MVIKKSKNIEKKFLTVLKKVSTSFNTVRDEIQKSSRLFKIILCVNIVFFGFSLFGYVSIIKDLTNLTEKIYFQIGCNFDRFNSRNLIECIDLDKSYDSMLSYDNYYVEVNLLENDSSKSHLIHSSEISLIPQTSKIIDQNDKSKTYNVTGYAELEVIVNNSLQSEQILFQTNIGCDERQFETNSDSEYFCSTSFIDTDVKVNIILCKNGKRLNTIFESCEY